MNTVIIVFMCISMLMSVYSTVVITFDIIKEYAERRQAAQATLEPQLLLAPVEQSEQTVQEPVPTVVEEAVAADGEGVRFSTNVPTLEEKYLALTPEYRGYYDEIVKYAAQMEESKRYKNVRYEEYKLGKTRLVRLLIKRGVVQAELILQNSSFKSYVTENKISVKAAATVIKVVDAATVQAVKDAIDIAVKTVQQEREERKRIAREKRREKRRQANEKK